MLQKLFGFLIFLSIFNEIVAKTAELPVSKSTNTEAQNSQLPQQTSFGQDPDVPQVESLPSLQKSIRPINIQSIFSSTSRTPSDIGGNVIRPLNANPLNAPSRSDESTMIEGTEIKPDDLDASTKPEGNTSLPYPDDLDHPDNHPERYYPIPVPFLKTPPKMHPAYTITRTFQPSNINRKFKQINL